MKALVIVHPSSLDAYTHAYGEAAGAMLAHRIYEKIEAHDGPVFLIDQQWPLGPKSKPRVALYNSLRSLYLQKDVSIEPFDEGGIEWSEYLDQFRQKLLDAGVREVVLGGLWYDLDAETGAVSEANRVIGKDIPSVVDDKIVALVPGSRRV